MYHASSPFAYDTTSLKGNKLNQCFYPVSVSLGLVELDILDFKNLTQNLNL